MNKSILFPTILLTFWLIAVYSFYTTNFQNIPAAKNLTEINFLNEIVPETTPGVEPAQLECMAMNIYHEARSESLSGQLAVATVTMNRVESTRFPDTVCEVVWQRNNRGCQFSWTCDGKPDQIRNENAYTKALKLAKEVLINGVRFITIDNDVMFYHADYISPNWEQLYSAQFITQVGRHKFYKVEE